MCSKYGDTLKVACRAGRYPLQLRFNTALTSQDYVREQAWLRVTLERCPLHPNGGCEFARHGTYERVEPPGTRVPRWYCPEGHRTFSLLADCFASRLPGSLTDLERVVVEAEQAKSLEAAANRVRTDDISLPGAIRWTHRRIQQVHITLRILLDLIPECLCGCQPTVTAFREWFNADWVLPQLREIAAKHLAGLPPPLGFAPRALGNVGPLGPIQHDKGPDPPPVMR
jgi:hypothetical protein